MDVGLAAKEAEGEGTAVMEEEVVVEEEEEQGFWDWVRVNGRDVLLPRSGYGRLYLFSSVMKEGAERSCREQTAGKQQSRTLSAVCSECCCAGVGPGDFNEAGS